MSTTDLFLVLLSNAASNHKPRPVCCAEGEDVEAALGLARTGWNDDDLNTGACAVRIGEVDFDDQTGERTAIRVLASWALSTTEAHIEAVFGCNYFDEYEADAWRRKYALTLKAISDDTFDGEANIEVTF